MLNLSACWLMSDSIAAGSPKFHQQQILPSNQNSGQETTFMRLQGKLSPICLISYINDGKTGLEGCWFDFDFGGNKWKTAQHLSVFPRSWLLKLGQTAQVSVQHSTISINRTCYFRQWNKSHETWLLIVLLRLLPRGFLSSPPSCSAAESNGRGYVCVEASIASEE